MAPQILPRYEELLRANQSLPEPIRQSAVLLRFATPIRESQCGEFHRIHLTPAMLDGGEAGFWMAESYQPHRLRMRCCPNCGQPLDQVNPSLARCRNKACLQVDGTPTEEFAIVTGPVRGVCKVLTFPDHIVERRAVSPGGPLVTWVSACVLILDRRYHPVVLAAIYRTAGQICEMHGWQLL